MISDAAWRGPVEIVRGKLQSACLGYGPVAEFAGGRWCDYERGAITRERWVTLRKERS